MDVLVPFDPREPKTRLSPFLTDEERREFATAMCRDVLESVRVAGGDPTVLATQTVDLDAPVTVDDRPLTEAVNAVLADSDDPVAVVVADLALATPPALERLFDAEGDVVLVPGLGGGTNAIVARHPDFRVDYHGASIRDHREQAAAVDATVAEVDSMRLSVDIDQPGDLVEVLLHGEGASATWLSEAGIELDTRNGRVTARRPD